MQSASSAPALLFFHPLHRESRHKARSACHKQLISFCDADCVADPCCQPVHCSGSERAGHHAWELGAQPVQLHD